MENTEPAVLLHEDIVNEISRLFSGLDILCTVRNKLQHFVGGREDTQERRDHRQDGIADFSQNNLRAPILFVPKRVSQIVGHRNFTLGSDVAVDVGLRVLNGLSHNIPELVLVHRLVHLGNEPSLRIV